MKVSGIYLAHRPDFVQRVYNMPRPEILSSRSCAPHRCHRESKSAGESSARGSGNRRTGLYKPPCCCRLSDRSYRHSRAGPESNSQCRSDRLMRLLRLSHLAELLLQCHLREEHAHCCVIRGTPYPRSRLCASETRDCSHNSNRGCNDARRC